MFCSSFGKRKYKLRNKIAKIVNNDDKMMVFVLIENLNTSLLNEKIKSVTKSQTYGTIKNFQLKIKDKNIITKCVK